MFLRINIKSFIFVLILSFLSPVSFAKPLPNEIVDGTQKSLAPMLKNVMPSVVNITAQGTLPFSQLPPQKQGPMSPKGDDDYDNESHENPNRPNQFQSAGSGVIINAQKGYVITNAHVVASADNITVTASDGRNFKAKLIGSDPASDIAVLQIEAKNLQSIPIGHSDQVKVGDFVLAIGNPFGLSQTVTSGIVSALGRTNLGIEGYENFIQTDAAINHGNSGGGLVNLKGELIGINTAIVTPDGGNIGISFAIPIDMAYSVSTQLIKYGKINRGLLGIMVQNLTPELIDAFQLENKNMNEGALITEITPDSPAAQSDLQVGDVIVQVDDKPVTSSSSVRNSIGLLRIGDPIKLTVLRDKKQIPVTIKIGDPHAIIKTMSKNNPFLHGVDLRDLHEYRAGHGYVSGVLVLYVDQQTPAWASHLRPGDIIVSIDKKPVHNMQELKAIVTQSPTDQPLLARILRNTGALFLVLRNNI
jgi:serine protease Do